MSDMLAEYAVTRDVALRDALVERHLPLVKFVARKLSSNLPENVDLGDLVSWGSIGLLDAIEKFEPSRGHQFSTYAVTRIRGDILDGLQKMEWAPKQVTSKVRAMRRVSEKLAIELGREPTVEEVAVVMEATPREVRGWMQDAALSKVKTLAPAGDDAVGMDVGEAADQDVAAEVVEIRSRMAVALTTLDEREARVLLLYYRDRRTLKEIAAELGISTSSSTQMHTRLLNHIQSRLAAYGEVA